MDAGEFDRKSIKIINFIKYIGKGSWFFVGVTALVLGAIGAFLPVLPTTPFVILAAFCFGKSTPRLQLWLESTKIFGPMITDWRENGAIAPRYKITAVSMMVLVFVASLIYGAPPLVLTLQATGMLLGAGYVLTRPN